MFLAVEDIMVSGMAVAVEAGVTADITDLAVGIPGPR
jgi:hypothetical protein